MSFQAVVFDLHGTLIEDLLTAGRDDLLAQMAATLSVPADDFAAAWQQTGKRRTDGGFDTVEECVVHICQALNARPDAERIEAAVELRIGYIRSRLRPRRDAVETLTRLRSLGLQIASISDCGLEVPMVWFETPFAPLIDAPLFSSREGLRKPAPALYLRACERLGVEPVDCLYVGDGNSRGLLGARDVGMTTVLVAVPGAVRYDDGQFEAAEWPGPRIATLKEIIDLVN